MRHDCQINLNGRFKGVGLLTVLAAEAIEPSGDRVEKPCFANAVAKDGLDRGVCFQRQKSCRTGRYFDLLKCVGRMLTCGRIFERRAFAADPQIVREEIDRVSTVIGNFQVRLWQIIFTSDIIPYPQLDAIRILAAKFPSFHDRALKCGDDRSVRKECNSGCCDSNEKGAKEDQYTCQKATRHDGTTFTAAHMTCIIVRLSVSAKMFFATCLHCRQL